MEIPFAEWYAAIPDRRSRRRYASIDIEPNLISHMQTSCNDFRPFPQARAELVTRSADLVLGGLKGSYGIIQGASTFIAFIGEKDDPHVKEKVGYTGEGIILEATARGLSTCWVAGSFRRGAASTLTGISKNERIFAVTPLGYAPGAYSLGEKILPTIIRARRRKPLSELTSGLDEKGWPQWMEAALDAARLAPSAYNRQPWRFHLEPDSITVSVDSPKRELTFPKRLDCGIAMLHIEVAAMYSGVTGEWEFLDPPQVARFTVVGGSDR